MFSARGRCINLNHRLDITSDSPGVQVYTGNYLGTPRKAVHGGATLLYSPHSAVAIEQQGWVDAINNPEWNIDQICESPVSYGPLSSAVGRRIKLSCADRISLSAQMSPGRTSRGLRPTSSRLYIRVALECP